MWFCVKHLIFTWQQDCIVDKVKRISGSGKASQQHIFEYMSAAIPVYADTQQATGLALLTLKQRITKVLRQCVWHPILDNQYALTASSLAINHQCET
jgi:hypothetical protein